MLAVTGAGGFIGTGLVAELERRGLPWRRIDRTMLEHGDGLSAALAGCGAIIHLAGLAHRDGAGAPPESEFRRVNGELPVVLARAAVAAGLRRMVFVSTIFVAGSGGGELLSPQAPARPEGAYARAKAEAEAGLREVSGIEMVILRPPLVYGPGARGNLARLEKLAALPIPLPFGAIRNKRDMVGRANLADALIFLAEAPGAAGQTFHICDRDPISLADLLTWMRASRSRGTGLLPVPAGIVRAALRAGLGAQRAHQLSGDFRVDASGLARLGWHPPHAAGFDYTAGAEKGRSNGLKP